MSVHFTRFGLFGLAFGAIFAAVADASELATGGTRWRAAVTLAAFATLLGLGLLFLGTREHPAGTHLRNVRIAAVLWAVGYLLLSAGSVLGTTTGVVLAVVGFVASDGALVTAVWALAGRLARHVLMVGFLLVAVAAAVSALLVLARGPAIFGLALPGHAVLLTGFYLTLRTLPDPGRIPFASRRRMGRRVRE